MKTKYILLFPLLSVLFPVAASAQGTVGDLESSFGARFSVEADKKLAKGVHAIVSGEARMTDGIGSPDRYQAGLELTYKLNDTFKFGVGYLLIEKMNSSGEWNPRHRFYADGKVSFRSGEWLFSVKERLQLTHREVGNAFQNTPNSLSLKSRFKVSYKGFGSVTPYGYVEVRNVFNDPACTATWSTASQSYSDYVFDGYSDAYFNRIRGSLGAEWKMSPNHTLDFFLLTDYDYDKEIDTNAEGTKLKSLTYDRGLRIGLGVGYKFSF